MHRVTAWYYHIHLRRHEAASELTLPIQCCLQEGCSGSFAKLWNLKTHLTKYYQSCQPNFNVMQFHRCEAASGVVENDVQTVETPQDYGGPCSPMAALSYGPLAMAALSYGGPYSFGGGHEPQSSVPVGRQLGREGAS